MSDDFTPDMFCFQMGHASLQEKDDEFENMQMKPYSGNMDWLKKNI
jgi:hypothetical protein